MLVKTRTAIEIAIARGLPASKVMARLGVTYEQYREVLDRMSTTDAW